MDRVGSRPAVNNMLNTTSFAMVASVVVVSAAMPSTAALGSGLTLGEPGSMLLLATALFGLASIVRRYGKGDDRP
jgi:hypothetical protein